MRLANWFVFSVHSQYDGTSVFIRTGECKSATAGHLAKAKDQLSIRQALLRWVTAFFAPRGAIIHQLGLIYLPMSKADLVPRHERDTMVGSVRCLVQFVEHM